MQNFKIACGFWAHWRLLAPPPFHTKTLYASRWECVITHWLLISTTNLKTFSFELKLNFIKMPIIWLVLTKNQPKSNKLCCKYTDWSYNIIKMYIYLCLVPEVKGSYPVLQSTLLQPDFCLQLLSNIPEAEDWVSSHQ